jgi:hypothetical protein
MNKRLINIFLIGLILLLSISLIAKSNQASDFKNQMAKLVLKQQVFEDEINDKGERLSKQEQIILSQKDAINQGLLIIDDLKKVNSQVTVITQTVFDTIEVVHHDTVVNYINGSAFLKLPQNYSYHAEYINFNAVIDVNGLSVNSLVIPNESKITIGYKRSGLFKPLEPIVVLKNTNPNIVTQEMSNVVIEEKIPIHHDKRVWGGLGFLVGLILN